LATGSVTLGKREGGKGTERGRKGKGHQPVVKAIERDGT
jgi:hypothetical protein